MSFSNPAGSDSDANAKYVSSLLALLNDRDPIAVMNGTPGALKELVSGIDDEIVRTREAPGKWSAAEVVVHLLDSEVVYGYRMRSIVAEPEQDIAGYDQDRWTTELRNNEAPLDSTLEAMTALRRWNMGWLATLSDAEKARWGNHAERGRESIAHIVNLLGAHDLVHLAQIKRILTSLGGL